METSIVLTEDDETDENRAQESSLSPLSEGVEGGENQQRRDEHLEAKACQPDSSTLLRHEQPYLDEDTLGKRCVVRQGGSGDLTNESNNVSLRLRARERGSGCSRKYQERGR